MNEGRRIHRLRRLAALSLLLCLLFSCSSVQYQDRQQIASLQKLCRVWGYVKYTHPAFLVGQRDWDAELISLIDSLSAAGSEKNANDTLYRWFTGLGDMDYGTSFIDQTWINLPPEHKLSLADTNWISDQAYLGADLSAALSRLGEIPVISRAKAPVQFDGFGGCLFSSEKSYEHIDYTDPAWRLLGLFRLWNAIEYYYPYRDILDEDWHALLLSSISSMLRGNDEESYDRTLAALSAKLGDAHAATSSLNSLLLAETGSYAVPAHITKADGVLVIERVEEAHRATCPLLPGDVLLKLNGEEIAAVVHRLCEIVAVPSDEKLLNQLGVWLLRSSDQMIEVTVLRNNAELTLAVQGVSEGFFSAWTPAERSHLRLEGDIGLINPSKLADGQLAQIMDEFSDTRGLIVDLRQYPKSYPNQSLDTALASYLLDVSTPFVRCSYPSETVPGVFLLRSPEQCGGGLSARPAEPYHAPVVLLMNEQTQSHAEYCVMSLRTGPNVVVLGENSIGADGNVTCLPLPDGDLMYFTGVGIYTPESGQTQRVGLSPDIAIHRTVSGVQRGRDELLEAAISYLLGR